jgi:hypothetical protein
MRYEARNMLLPFLITSLILVILEILTTTLLPIFGFVNYALSFHILIVLYMGFKLQTPYLALFILFTQYVHSFFTIEGWEVGTIAGILTCILISYLRDLVHLTSSFLTILVTFFFQIFWFLMVSLIIYMRTGSGALLLDKFWRFLPESIMLALMAPFLFAFLDKVWRASSSGVLGEEA